MQLDRKDVPAVELLLQEGWRPERLELPVREDADLGGE